MRLPWEIQNLKWRDLPWVKGLVVLAVLGLSALAYPLAQRVKPLYLFGALGALVFGLIALRQMKFALILVLLTSATTGVTLGTGTATALPLGLLAVAGLTAVWLLGMMLFDHEVHLKPSPLNLPLLAFLVAALISWIVGYVLWDWKLPAPKSNLLFVQAGQYALFALSFAVMFLVAHQSLDQKDLRRWMWIVIGIGMAGIAAETLFGSYRLRDMGVTGSLYIFPTILFAAQLLYNPSVKRWLWLVGFIALALFAAWAYRNLEWKGGWVTALLGLALLFLLHSRKSFLLVLLASALVAYTQWDYLVERLFLPEIGSTSTARPLFWLDVIRMTARSPVLGLGLANYMFYWADPSFVPLSRLQVGWNTWDFWGYAPPSHNMFVDIYAQTGLLGLGLFLWAMGAALWLMFSLARRLPPGFSRAYVYGVLCGFAAMLAGSFLFADWLIPFVYNITITGFRHSVYAWILLGSVLSIYFNQEKFIRESGS